MDTRTGEIFEGRVMQKLYAPPGTAEHEVGVAEFKAKIGRSRDAQARGELVEVSEQVAQTMKLGQRELERRKRPAQGAEDGAAPESLGSRSHPCRSFPRVRPLLRWECVRRRCRRGAETVRAHFTRIPGDGLFPPDSGPPPLTRRRAILYHR